MSIRMTPPVPGPWRRMPMPASTWRSEGPAPRRRHAWAASTNPHHDNEPAGVLAIGRTCSTVACARRRPNTGPVTTPSESNGCARRSEGLPWPVPAPGQRASGAAFVAALIPRCADHEARIGCDVDRHPARRLPARNRSRPDAGIHHPPASVTVRRSPATRTPSCPSSARWLRESMRTPSSAARSCHRSRPTPASHRNQEVAQSVTRAATRRRSWRSGASVSRAPGAA